MLEVVVYNLIGKLLMIQVSPDQQLTAGIILLLIVFVVATYYISKHPPRK